MRSSRSFKFWTLQVVWKLLRKFIPVLSLTVIALGAVPALVQMDSQLMAEDALSKEKHQDTTQSSAKDSSKTSAQNSALTSPNHSTGESSKEDNSREPKKDTDKKSKASKLVVDESVVEDIRNSREEVMLRKKELDQRESDLNAREKAVREELQKLNGLRDQVSKTQELRQKENLEKVNKLVETLLAMSPRSASKVLSAVDTSLAVAAMEKMDTQPLAKIMNLMDPKKSSRLSELLAGSMHAKKDQEKAEVPK